MEFSHINSDGGVAMVDISQKADTVRCARASGLISMSSECYEKIKNGGIKKGNVLTTAQLAGIQASKQTAALIPLCHSIQLTNSSVEFELLDSECTIKASCTVSCTGKTGAEMEALTGASVALLTIYDMCKALDKSMQITKIHLCEKTGGKSGHFKAND